jgi:hypothetical protein
MTIYGLAYNESFMLPFFVAHYRKNFPGCRIVIYNNMSDDGTKEIALSLDCEVIDYDTDGKLSDAKYLEIKNNCWKGIEADENGDRWVMIVDIDEFCEINERDLKNETGFSTIVNFEGWNLVAMDTTLDITTIKHGVRAPSYDKNYLFNATYINEINYLPGCHRSNPQGTILRLGNTHRALHYKYINIDYMIARHAHYASRMSEENIRKGWAVHYHYPPEQIREEFEAARKNAIKIL